MNETFVLVEQPGVLACLSRRRSRVQIPSRTLAARYANRLSGEAQTFVSAGSTPACATYRVVLLVAACKAVVTKQARWMTRGSIPSQPSAARSSIGSGHQPLKLEGRVRFPHGSLMAKWCNWRAPTEGWSARRSERRALAAWEFESPLGHFNVGRQEPVD